jgi:glutaredoxin
VSRVRALWLLCALAALVGPGVGCKRSHASTSSAGADAPPITVKDDTQGLLLTWIDDKGDFHVETRVGDVPLMGRDSVRVVDPNRDDGTHADRVYVADLRQPRPDGAYPVRTMTRADFEAIAVARREKTGPTLASAAPPPASGEPGAQADRAEPDKPASRPVVILYGASWCGACHQAEQYLRRKGIPYIEKDVDKDPAAAREMQQKLAKNGLPAGSIPVIDVRGKVMVGFDPQAIDSALGEAL